MQTQMRFLFREFAPPGLKALNLYAGSFPQVTRSPGLKSGAGTNALPPIKLIPAKGDWQGERRGSRKEAFPL
jgi:hypothetical protein